MEKDKYELIKAIKTRLAKGEKTEFWERNIVNIYDKRQKKKKSVNQPTS